MTELPGTDPRGWSMHVPSCLLAFQMTGSRDFTEINFVLQIRIPQIYAANCTGKKPGSSGGSEPRNNVCFAVFFSL